MQVTPQAPSARPAAKTTTEVIAARLGIRPQTVRAAYCRDGHYLGLLPVKLPNGRLLWDEAEVDALIAGRAVKAPDDGDLNKHFQRKAAEATKVLPHIRAKSEARARRLAGEVSQ